MGLGLVSESGNDSSAFNAGMGFDNGMGGGGDMNMGYMHLGMGGDMQHQQPQHSMGQYHHPLHHQQHLHQSYGNGNGDL
jgi:hypothetical protein